MPAEFKSPSKVSTEAEPRRAEVVYRGRKFFVPQEWVETLDHEEISEHIQATYFDDEDQQAEDRGGSLEEMDRATREYEESRF